MAEQEVLELQEEKENQNNRKGSDRRSKSDRRSGMDRRCLESEFDGPERRIIEEERRAAMERRRGPGRRRCDDRRSAEEGEMTDDQFELIKAIDEYKRVNNKPFPSYTEILEIVIALGYRKVAEPGNIMKNKTEDD